MATKDNPVPVKPFKKLDEVYLSEYVPGPYTVGERFTILSVVNNGTKRNPIWRYYVRGAWYDHDMLSVSDPLEGIR